MAQLVVTPNPATPGQTVDVDGSGFNPKVKFALETVDPNGVAVGQATNINRPRRDGTFRVGINVPPVKGVCKVRAYQSNVIVASVSVTVQDATTPPPPPPPPPPTTRTINVAAGQRGYVVKQGEVVENLILIGPGDGTYDGRTVGIYAANISDFTIRNVEAYGFGDAGFRFDNVSNFLIEKVNIHDCSYAGIIGTGCSKGTVQDSLVERIGTRGHQRDCNAYGVVWSMWAGGKVSSDIVTKRTTVNDVPLWHGFDTHGGFRIQFLDNTTRRCARPVFITPNLDNEIPVDCVVSRNLLLEPKANVAAGGTDSNSAITLISAVRPVVTDNIVTSAGYPNLVYNYANASTGIVQSGNVRGESR